MIYPKVQVLRSSLLGRLQIYVDKIGEISHRALLSNCINGSFPICRQYLIDASGEVGVGRHETGDAPHCEAPKCGSCNKFRMRRCVDDSRGSFFMYLRPSGMSTLRWLECHQRPSRRYSAPVRRYDGAPPPSLSIKRSEMRKLSNC